FETNNTDLAESVITEQTNELTNVSKETKLSTGSLNLREASWVWEYISKEYNTKNELKSLICTICRLKYKLTNTPGTLAKHLYNKHSNLVGNRQSTLDKFIALFIKKYPDFNPVILVEEDNLPSPLLVQSNENETSERLGRNSGPRSWVWKYFNKSDYNNIGVCNVLNDSGKKCNVQLKIVGGSTSSLMFHLRNHHDIMQDEPDYA
ncbi:37364_t:CDS:2, partial [Gigaspora margarita]